jgi:hypothetical protein
VVWRRLEGFPRRWYSSSGPLGLMSQYRPLERLVRTPDSGRPYLSMRAGGRNSWPHPPTSMTKPLPLEPRGCGRGSAKIAPKTGYDGLGLVPVGGLALVKASSVKRHFSAVTGISRTLTFFGWVSNDEHACHC